MIFLKGQKVQWQVFLRVNKTQRTTHGLLINTLSVRLSHSYGTTQRIFSSGTNVHTHVHCGIDLDKHACADKGGSVPCVHTDTCITSVHTYTICETQIQHHILKHATPCKHFVLCLSISRLLIHSERLARLPLADRVPSAAWPYMQTFVLWFAGLFRCNAFNHH